MQLSRPRPQAVAGALVALGIAALDQGSKLALRRAFPGEGGGFPVLEGFLDIRHVRNTGAAWGVLAGFQTFLIVFSLVMLVLLLRHRQALLGNLPRRWLVVGLLVGGIVGNLVDRVWLGYVVDFIDCHWGRHHFPAFNVADASICTGVGLFMLLHARTGRAGKPPGGGA